jgi:hypothetical protein
MIDLGDVRHTPPIRREEDANAGGHAPDFLIQAGLVRANPELGLEHINTTGVRPLFRIHA